MAVATYLKHRRLSNYAVYNSQDVRLLLAPNLARSVKSLELGLKKYLFWKIWDIRLYPSSDHFHSPACRH